MSAPSLPPLGPDLMQWAKSLTEYLRRTLDRLRYKRSDDSPAQDGTILWDGVNSYPVVAKSGEYRQAFLTGCYAQFGAASDITAAATDTAYSITYDAPSVTDKVDRDGTNPERIVFTEGGLYVAAFTAQISSTSGATVTFRFWPAINGANIAGSTMTETLHENGATRVVSRAAVFSVSAGDYLEAKWAVDRTTGRMEAHAATAYAPASPSTTLIIYKIET